MAKKNFKAQNLKAILIFVFIVVCLGSGSIFYFGLQDLRQYATEVNHRLRDAEASNNQVQALQTLKNQLSQSQQLVSKANLLFATPDTYQPQALTDIKNHAAEAGLSVSGTEFDSSETESGQQIVTVKLAAPVSFTKFVSFLNGIEGNLPKMQVSSVTLTHVSGGGSDSVAVSDIKIAIFIR